jgi:hypothetical protein
MQVKRGYRHKQANRLANERHQKKNKAIKLTDSVKNYISEKLKDMSINMSLWIEYCCFCIGLLTFRFNVELVEE